MGATEVEQRMGAVTVTLRVQSDGTLDYNSIRVKAK